MTPSEQAEFLLRNVDHTLPEGELAERIAEGRALRVKLGMDPTAPSVTLGWAVVLRKLREFQDLGHTAVLIVGNFTAQVGDPSGKSETRPRLSAEEVQGYADSVLDQFGLILRQDHLEVRYNAEWLKPLDMADVLRLSSSSTLAQMLERDDFSKRYAANTPISMTEFMYPLLQGYDSVAVQADIELGGSDQLFNLVMGRRVQERYGQRPQMALTMPLLVGTDGQKKMSQSLGNYVGVTDPPDDMYGKTMSIPDDLMPQWFELATDLPWDEVLDLRTQLQDGLMHPAEAKRRLARSIVSLYHDDDAAVAAEAAFNRVIRDGEIPEDVDEYDLPAADPVMLAPLLRDSGLVASGGEARRMLSQGAVKLNGVRVASEALPRDELAGAVLQVGKRKFIRLI